MSLDEPVLERVRKEVAALIRVAPSSLDNGVSLFDLGFDSILVVELVSVLEEIYEVRIDAVFIWRHSSIQRLSDAIEAALRQVR